MRCSRLCRSMTGSPPSQLLAQVDITPEVAERAKHEVDQRSSQWLALRQFRLTASNFAAAVGRDYYVSATAVMNEMVRISSRGLCHSPESEAATTYGQTLEQHALDVYAATSPSRRLLKLGLVISPEMPWLACSPDAIVCDDRDGSVGLLEVKCPTVRIDLTPQQNPTYMAQIQGTMGLLRLDWCDFLVWSHRTGLMVHRVNFDKDYFSKLLAQLHKFYFSRFIPFAAKRWHGLSNGGEVADERCQANFLKNKCLSYWCLVNHLLVAVPALSKDFLINGKRRAAAPARWDEVRLVHRMSDKHSRIPKRVSVSVLFRPLPVVLVAGDTYHLREHLRQNWRLQWCPIWRAWRSKPFDSLCEADAMVSELAKFFEDLTNNKGLLLVTETAT